MISLKNMIIFIFMIFSLFFHKAEAQTWERIIPNFHDDDTLYLYTDITFANKNIGWVHKVSNEGAGKIFKTTDGGINWSLKMKNKDIFSFSKIFSLEPDYFITIWGYEDCKILITKDGGSIWDSTSYKFIGGSNKIYFFDRMNGFAAGRYRWFTNDGGYSWKMGDDTTYFPFPTDICFANDRLGWMVSNYSIATDAGSISKTTDGGKTWKYQDSSAGIMFGVDFIDSLKGTAVGYIKSTIGFICTTIDGGNHWTFRQMFNSGPYWDVGFLDENNGWIIGNGKIMRTTNGGMIWETQLEGIKSMLKKLIILKKDKVAYILGDDYNNTTHTLLYADLSNITSVNAKKETPYKRFRLSQNYPNPFNFRTVIEYEIKEPSFIKLKIYNVFGNLVRTLVDKSQVPGDYKTYWDGRNDTGGEISSGIYIYKLVSNKKVESKKLILLK